MANPQLVTADGEAITLGPFNADQAPHIECSNCGGAITVGQRLVPSMTEAVLGMTVQTHRLVYVTPPDQEGQAPVHSDCSAEYAHDQITHEPCVGEEEDVSECEYCGVEIPDGYRLCGKHADILGPSGAGDAAPMLERGQLHQPVLMDDIKDQIEMIENVKWTQEALFKRAQFRYQENNWVTLKLWEVRDLLEKAAREMATFRGRTDIFPDD